MNFFQVATELPQVQPDTVFSIGSLNVTNAMLGGVFVTLLLFIMAVTVANRRSVLPGAFQTIVEMMVEAFEGLLVQLTGSERAARTMLPLIGTLFLFFGISNIIFLIPGLSSVTYNGTPIFRTPTNDFNMTFSIALAMVLLTQWASIKSAGIFGHIGKYIKIVDVLKGFRNGIGAGMLAIIDFAIGLLDIVSEFAKVISLSLRLFGNMFAGEMLAAVLLGTFAIILPAPWLAMNLLVGILQAIVFGALTAAYFTLAVDGETE